MEALTRGSLGGTWGTVLLPIRDDDSIDWTRLEAALDVLVAAADPVPLVLYNPPHAKTQVPADLYPVIRREVPAVIGIKVAGGDARWYAELRRHAAGLAVFVAGHSLATGWRHGAAGSYSNIAALSPAGAMAWQRMIVARPDAALDGERRIHEFFAAHVHRLQHSGYANPALDKFLAHLGGWADIGTRVRWPYESVDASLAVRLRPLARAQLPELFPGE
ncbi:hypothetical protein [Nonomuraea sp. NPDC049695]|uniref:dihydrodipicolinate synthase family protein n=1 Tax=Nonomuraea sp. NPDC049695 TaxID=3154734 RepID=UPI00342C53E3